MRGTDGTGRPRRHLDVPDYLVRGTVSRSVKLGRLATSRQSDADRYGEGQRPDERFNRPGGEPIVGPLAALIAGEQSGVD